jgi:uncharacterized protein (DUF362 family)
VSATQDVHAKTVALSRLDDVAYPSEDRLPVLRAELVRLTRLLGWADAAGGFNACVPAGARVVVKPNWVLDHNEGPWGIEPLITHASLIRVTVEELLRSPAASVLVADAPLQSCDFAALLRATQLEAWSRALQARDPRYLGIRDLRRTVRHGAGGQARIEENVRDLEDFVLFDLRSHSLLEPISAGGPPFRVTQYDPKYLAQTHGVGKHQYLIAREFMEADLVVNLPKLKTHKKAGITCALKNLVGINGNKEYLPHHRLGGAEDGGDCYPGRNPVKRVLERAYDRYNSASPGPRRRAWALLTQTLANLLVRFGDRVGIEGSWSGNDTVWRMALDLNRVLLYGDTEGGLATAPRRRVLHVVDAIIGGQGDGPLRSEPLPLGLLMAGDSAPALDWVGAIILGYNPRALPIVRHAFDPGPRPLVAFGPEAIEVVNAEGASQPIAALEALTPEGIHIPFGWQTARRHSAAAPLA